MLCIPFSHYQDIFCATNVKICNNIIFEGQPVMRGHANRGTGNEGGRGRGTRGRRMRSKYPYTRYS